MAWLAPLDASRSPQTRTKQKPQKASKPLSICLSHRSRLEQVLTESCTLPLSRKPLAGFLQWRTQDIKKVNTAKLEASGLECKQA